ncbi:hypothetical protein R3I94_009753 [Phoxinus phoxinus]|uniref:Uncharacterized protein n=1 Tax=Phoxinus phoxinus TaxID=58324 RepID=A0AAN9D4H4_9TELE
MKRENEMIQTRASVCAPCFSSSLVFGSRGGGDGRTAEVRGWDSRGGVRVEREQRHRREEKRKEGVGAASVPRGACQISQSHTLFPSGGCTKRQCRQSLDSDLCTQLTGLKPSAGKDQT